MSNKISENCDSIESLKVAIVGGGLVGSLASIHLAQKGYDVHLYEFREDPRTSELVQGKSINLALSQRGRLALAQVGLEKEILAQSIPMRGRMLHDLNGNMTSVPYDPVNNQCLYSVGRKLLNEIILTAADKFENIHLNFNKKLVSAKLEEGQLSFVDQKTNAELQTTSDLVIGCDGAYSAVRQQMVKRPGFCFSQEYIEHGYKELCIPSKNGDFAMPPNFLHIWPRDSFMMIALPNQDKSFTVTLSMPFTFYSTLKSEQDLLDFFEKYYPDAIPLIGKQRLIDDFFQSGPQFLVSIKCKPYHLGSTALLLGDAAHAMVPYYGQGMNAGFEDCTILSAILSQKGIKLGDALQQYSKIRKDDAHAICDLAMYNYTEMRDLVTKKSFKFRKTFDEFLYRLFPKFWVPLYSSVSFSSMPYNQCIKNRKWQDKMLSRLTYGITLVTGISGAYFAYLNFNSS